MGQSHGGWLAASEELEAETSGAELPLLERSVAAEWQSRVGRAGLLTAVEVGWHSPSSDRTVTGDFAKLSLLGLEFSMVNVGLT